MRPQTGSSTRELRGVGETEPLAVPARLSPPLRFADTVISNSSWKILGLGAALCHWRANGHTCEQAHSHPAVQSHEKPVGSGALWQRGAHTRQSEQCGGSEARPRAYGVGGGTRKGPHREQEEDGGLRQCLQDAWVPVTLRA